MSRSTIRRMLGAATAVALWAVAGTAGAAEAPPPEVFFRHPAAQEAVLSPSGRRLAISTDVKGRVGVFVVDLQSPDFKITRAALFSDVDVGHVWWVDDERLVFDLVDLQAGSGEDYRVAPGLFAVRYDGAEMRTLVERFGRPFVTNGERRDGLPRSHALLHVPQAAEDPAGVRADEVIVGEWVWRQKDLQTIVPKRLNTRDGRVEDVPTKGAPERVVRWWFSAQGEPRAALARQDGRDSLHWYQAPRDGTPGRWVQLAEGTMHALPFHPLWVGEGDRLYVGRREGPAGERVVSPFDFAQGRPGATLVQVPGFDFSGQLIGDREGRRLLGVQVQSDAEQTVWLDPARKALQQRVDESLPGRVNRVSCRRCDAADAVVVVRSWSDRHPGQLLLWSAADQGGKGRWRVIATLQPGIDPERMGTLEMVRIRARDGRDLPVWITRPADFRAGQPRPAVVLVHGGPWVRHGQWQWDPMPQFLASRGYVVIEPEFRGSDGYGLAHLQAGFRQFGQAMQDDVADALRWAQAQKIATDKACIAGGSYGGYSTLMGLIRHPELYRCGSAWFAVADLMLYVDGGWFVRDDISGQGREHVLRERVGDPDKDRAMLLAQSPVEQAARLKAPLQLVFGADDLRVPLAHGKRLRSSLQAAGREPEWIVYDGEGHGLRLWENQVDMAKKLEAFLERHLK